MSTTVDTKHKLRPTDARIARVVTGGYACRLLVRQTAFFSDENSDNTPYDDTQKNSGVQFYPYYRLKATGTPKSHYCELEDRDPKVYELWKQNFYRNDDKQTDLLCRADSLNHSIYLGNPDLSDCQLIIEQGTRFDEIGIEVQDDEDVNPQMTEGNSADGRKHQNDQTEQKLAAIKDAAMLAERDTRKSMQKTVGCCWTEKPLELPANVRNTGGLLEFYTKLDNGQTILLAQLNPKIPVQEIENRDEAFAFEAEYRLLLTQDGDCHLFIGEVPPYWEANDPQKWVWPGQVYRKNINRPEDDDDSDLDPFNGRQ